MGEEIDPNWPPPQPTSPDQVDPNWLPPEKASSAPSGGERRGLGPSSWWLAALAITAGIGIGVVVTLLLVTWGRSSHVATPSASSTAPIAPAPSAIPAPPPSAASPAPGVTPPPAVELPLNPLRYVQIGTQSGQTWCDIMQDWVGCETSATNWPTVDGERAHDVKVTAGGDFHWVVGNLGRMTYKVTLGYQTYHALGWTISATEDGTTFTNDRTGHGMRVSVENVSSF